MHRLYDGNCARCGAEWKSETACHCNGCHRTFSSLSGFDAHRRNLKCVDPATVGLEKNAKGWWRHPLKGNRPANWSEPRQADA